MTLLPSREIRLMARGVFGLLAAVALAAPLLQVPSTPFALALFWGAALWWVLRLSGNLLWPQQHEQSRHAQRLELGRVQDLRDGAAGSLVASLVFLVAFQHAKLAALWVALAALALFASFGTLVVSWVAQSHPDKFPPAEPLTEEQLSKRARAFRRSQLIGVAILASWLYAWWGLTA